MKNILVIIIFIFFGATANAQKDTVKSSNKTTTKVSPGATKYFYYPEANIYFNETNSSYSYFDAATSTWMTAPQLPASYSINKNSPKTEIVYNGADVWTDNTAHQKKFGTKKDKMSPKP